MRMSFNYYLPNLPLITSTYPPFFAHYSQILPFPRFLVFSYLSNSQLVSQ